jgi:hypothetical protein
VLNIVMEPASGFATVMEGSTTRPGPFFPLAGSMV